MIDFSGELGARAKQRLQGELVIWLTTTDAAGQPQPRPVWFIWEDESFLIYSQTQARKVQHIARNPRVALHFDGGPQGDDIQVFAGDAEIVAGPTPAHQVGAYLQKYSQAIRDLGYSAEAFAGEYPVAIRVHPRKLRGWASSG